MNRRFFYLSTCDTCRRILKALQPGPDLVLQDIKTEPIQPGQLDEMAARAGSYEALFSRRAVKYREQGLASQNLGEQDFRRLILEEYTFLRRPVLLWGEQIFIGSDPAAVAGMQAALGSRPAQAGK